MNEHERDEYASLWSVLEDAYRQSAAGKGSERHAINATPFEQQPILSISRALREEGLGFPLGQAIKKATESVGMVHRGQHEAAERELLGAIVYLAAGVLLIRER